MPIHVPTLNFNIQIDKFFRYVLHTGTRPRYKLYKRLGPHLMDPCKNPDPMLLLNTKLY